MKHFLYSLFFFSIIGFLTAKEIAKDDLKIENEVITTIIPENVESSSVPTTTIKKEEMSVLSTTEENFNLENSEDNLGGLSESQQPGQRRKILYINQQQSGKFNVQLELNDVSLIVIPNKKDPQLSLLNLLLRSAQKSNVKKDENQQLQANKKIDDENSKLENTHKTTDEYSKYKNDNFIHPSTSEPYPSVESRVAPYKVDISSTLGLPSPVEIIPNANLMARSPSVKVLKTLPSNLNQRFKRSIDTRFYGLNFDSPVLSDHSISSDDNEEEELAESITNSLENSDKINTISNTDEFILLGAVENCGPGRKRNSYQICVNDNNE